MNIYRKVLSAAITVSFLITGMVETHASADTHQQVEPYYHFEGYTGHESSFALNPYFVQALYYGNLHVNGIQVTKKAVIEDRPLIKKVNDTKYYVSHGAATSMSFPVKWKSVKKSDFMKSHRCNTVLSDQRMKAGKSVVTFKTKYGTYSATFDRNRYLNKIRINPAVMVYSK
ncbi:hypothetical protein ERX37_09660 [Macrococcus hajekii]|uniref:Immunodominant staphylococcal antigen B n=1 Tax=Macrococcus hajekii TaxID=198482 RepID=A0A4R6BIH4_9STAP|nr:hypothetical protein [Macrococcus hajekii]TDM01368.1 hypothetical protein ERX37_09660 [Macrococcus hajekii]GGB11008.1 hypothetical protein GCM10007190_18900 [Macrococcus hajekii]